MTTTSVMFDNSKKHSKNRAGQLAFFAAVALAAGLQVAAATLDLAGVGTNITDVAELAAYDCVTNSSETLATLTFNLAGSVVQEYAGVISGNIRLVKDGGKSKLKLSGANTYTGGTLVQNGVIIVGNATACGNPSTTVTIDHFYPQDTSNAGPWCSLQFDVSGFANPISLPEGTTQPAWANQYYCNHSLCVTNTGLSIDSPISGGFFSFLATQKFATTAEAGTVAEVTFNGPIKCTGMRVYQDGDVHFCGAVTNDLANIRDNSSSLSQKLHFYSPANRFNTTSIDFQSGCIYAENDDVFNGIDSVIFTKHNKTSAFYLKGHAVTIGRVRCAGATDAGGNYQIVDGGSGNHSVLTMKGGEDTISNLRFKNNMTLVWDPTGDCTFTATSNRTSTLKGPLVVKGGTFELDGGHTMLNLTNIVVKSGATLKVSSGTPFPPSVTILAEPGATLNLAEDITAATVKVGDHYLSAKGFSAGTYKGLTIAGAGSLVVSSKPGGEDTYTWTGGGADDNITTTNNWRNSDMPDFDDEAPFIVFAGGTAAVLDRDITSSGITFDGVSAFELSAASGYALSLGAGGISNAPAANASAVTVSAPVMPMIDQIWQMDTNVTFTLSGILKRYGSTAPTITVRQSSTADPTITFIGSPTPEGASDFAGDIVFARNDISANPVRFGTAYVRASGYEPFGPTGTLTLESTSYPISATESINKDADIESAERGRYPCLFLTNAVVSKSVSIPSTYGAVIAADASSTNELKGALTLSGDTSHPHFKVGPDSLLAVDASYSKTAGAGVEFRQFYCKASDNSGSGRIVFRGKLTLGNLKVKNPMTIELNAVSNSIDKIVDARSTDFSKPITIVCGGENAFHDGSCKMNFSYTASGTRYANFDINGHDQYIGTPSAGSAGAAFVSSDGEAVLRVNCAANGNFLGTVATNVVLQKEGDSTLTFSNSKAFKAGSTLAVSNGTVAVSNATALNEDVTLKLLGGTISIPSGQTALVGETFYLDANGDMKQLPRGSYGPGDGKVGSFFAPGSGSIRVRKGAGRGFIVFVE